MNRLTWYIAKNVFGATLLVVFIVSCLFVLFAFIAQASSISPQFTYLDLMEFVILSMPSNIYLILPVGCLIGSIMGLGHLASHSELVAMRAAGVSIRKIAQAVLKVSIVLALLTFGIGAFVGPYLQHKASVQKMLTQDAKAILYSAKSTWLRSGNSFIHLDSVGLNGSLKGVTRYDVKNGMLAEYMHAQSASYHSGQNWTLEKVKQTQISTDKIQQSQHQQVKGVSLVDPKVLTVLASPTDNLTLPGLISYIHYRQTNALSTSSYELQLYQLFFQAISVVILMLLAVPFVFGPLRSSSFGYRLLLGVVIGFLFYLFNQSMGNVVLAYHGSPFIGAATPTIVFTLLLGIYFWRMT